MIVVLFGQPCSGKTTLAKELKAYNIDGDKIRTVFTNKDYSKEGRIKNLNRASDIAHYLNQSVDDIRLVLSLVYPYKEARDYLNTLTNEVLWVYLTYNEERGRESYHVEDFEIPQADEVDLMLNTTEKSLEECVDLIKTRLNEKYTSKGEW